MNRLNFEEDNHELIDDVQDSEVIMETSMGLIHEILIEPNEKKLSPDDMMILGVIGEAFKIIASKARAHELMNEMGEQHPDSVN